MIKQTNKTEIPSRKYLDFVCLFFFFLFFGKLKEYNVHISKNILKKNKK